MKKRLAAIAMALVACALAVCALAGCSTAQNENTSEAAQNREYMSQLNEAVSGLTEIMTNFSTAVSDSDLVTMQSELAEAQKIVDEISSLEAPSDLQDIKQGYVDGAKLLQQALTAYVELFSSGDSLSANEYADKLASAQDLYGQAIDKLLEADSFAADNKAATNTSN